MADITKKRRISKEGNTGAPETFSEYIMSIDTPFERKIRGLTAQVIKDPKQRSVALDAANNLTRTDCNTADMYLAYKEEEEEWRTTAEYWLIAEKQRQEWAWQLFQALGLDKGSHEAAFTSLTLEDCAAFSIVEQSPGKPQEQLELATGKPLAFRVGLEQQLTTQWREEQVIGVCELAKPIRRSARSRKKTDFFS